MSAWIELYHAAFDVVNLPTTLLLILVLLYWTTVILGVMDLSTLDVDLPEPDMEMGDAGVAGFEAFLEYFNIRYVPVSIVISLFSLSLWVVGMTANSILNPGYNGLVGLGIFVLNLPLSAHAAKFMSLPLVPLFKSMRSDATDKRDLVGCRVVVTSSKADPHFGQAEIRGDGPPITLSVRTEEGEIPRGREAVILSHQPEKDIYILTTLEI